VARAFQEYLDPAYLSSLDNLSLMARTAVEGFLSGMHRSVYHGFGTEFLQYRNYVPGEDLKYLDWKVYARRDTLMTKVYQEETSMNVYFVVDASASHRYRGERAACSKLHYASMVAASLAYLATRQGDNIALFAYQDHVVEALEPGRRNGQLNRFLQALTRLTADGRADHRGHLNKILHHMRNRGLVIYISDMLEAEDELPEALKTLRLHHCDCLAVQVLDPDEQDLPHAFPARYQDAESGEELTTFAGGIREDYQSQMSEYQSLLKSRFRDAQVDYIQLSTTDNLGLALGRYLSHRES